MKPAGSVSAAGLFHGMRLGRMQPLRHGDDIMGAAAFRRPAPLKSTPPSGRRARQPAAPGLGHTQMHLP